MDFENLILQIISEQRDYQCKIPVDLTLQNGNLFLRSFHITGYNKKTKEVEGLTMLEEYSYVREQREPVYCKLKTDEIKSISCSELEIQKVCA